MSGWCSRDRIRLAQHTCTSTKTINQNRVVTVGSSQHSRKNNADRKLAGRVAGMPEGRPLRAQISGMPRKVTNRILFKTMLLRSRAERPTGSATRK
jgi:hypothetical protein